jgi:hypothetical protein
MYTNYDPTRRFVAIAEQSQFGVPISNSGSYLKLLCDPIEVTGRAKTFEVPDVGGHDFPSDDAMQVSASGSMPTFTLTGPASIYTLHQLLYAFWQQVVQCGDTGKESYWFSAASGSKPDFSADEGHYLTVLNVFPDPSNEGQHLSHKYADCISNSMKLSIAADELLQGEFGMVARGAGTTNNDTSVATFTEPQGATNNLGLIDFWDITDASINFETAGGAPSTSADLILNKIEFGATQDVLRQGPNGKHSFVNYGILNRAGTFSIEIKKDAAAESVISQYVSGQPVRVFLRLGAKHVPEVGNLAIECHGKLTADPTFPDNGEIGCVLTGKFTGTDCFTVRLCNGKDESW